MVRFSGRAISRCHAEQEKPLVLGEQKLALSVAEWVEGEASGHSMRGQVRLRETLLIRRPDPSLSLRMTNERNGLLTMRLQDARKNAKKYKKRSF